MAVKLFVGGLAFATSSNRLREAFATIGTVASVRVVTDPAGQSRGFGFVEMETIEAAQDADRKSTRLNSSHVAISYAVFCLKKKKSWCVNFALSSPLCCALPPC